MGDQKDTLGRTVKKRLREQVYSKILRLGVHAAEEVGMAGLTQMALEGIEQRTSIIPAISLSFFMRWLLR